MPPSSSAKVLRVAIVQGGKIIEERLLPSEEQVTLGPDAQNTFVVPGASLPASVAVFERHGGRVALLFSERTEGKVFSGGTEQDLVALRAKAQKRGNAFAAPLTDTSKGRVSLGDITVLFQFVQPPPPPPHVELPSEMRGSVFASMDRLFLGMLLASVAAHFGLALLIALSPKPSEEDLALDQLPDRFAKVLIPVKPPEPEKAKEKEAKADEPKHDDKPKKKEVESDPVARKAAIAKKVESKGLLRVLGSMGAKGGALDDVLGGSTGAADIASAISGAAGVQVADSASVGGPRGGGSGQQTGIGDLGTSGGGKVNLGNKGDVRVVGHVQDSAPDVDSPDVDKAALVRYIKARLKAIEGCYERELKRNPSLRGKISVRFSITPAGRAGAISIGENSLNEGVASCIQAVIHGWVFPFKPADEVPVEYPFVFSPAS
jgi:hypothetical protein